MLAADEGHVGLPWQVQVVRILAAASEQEQILLPWNRPADPTEIAVRSARAIQGDFPMP
jgi:hypothetical protein